MPGEEPREEPGETPEEETGEAPEEETGELPGEEPREQPGEASGEQPGEQPGGNGRNGCFVRQECHHYCAKCYSNGERLFCPDHGTASPVIGTPYPQHVL